MSVTRLLIAVCLFCASSTNGSEGNRILIFGKTIRPAHASIIPLAGEALKAALNQRGYSATFSPDPSSLTSVSDYKGVILLDVSEGIIDQVAQSALEKYVRKGGALLAIHASISAGKDWPWLQETIGTLFLDHPPMQNAEVTLRVDDLTQARPISWLQVDEWYNFTRPIPKNAELIATVDEKSYLGGKMGNPHAISWGQKFGKGRVIYTAMGHDVSLYENSSHPFMIHIFNCLQRAVGFPSSARL